MCIYIYIYTHIHIHIYIYICYNDDNNNNKNKNNYYYNQHNKHNKYLGHFSLADSHTQRRDHSRESFDRQHRRLSLGVFCCQRHRLQKALAHLPVREKNIPFGRAVALRSGSRGCSPAPDVYVFRASTPKGLLIRRGPDILNLLNLPKHVNIIE